MIGVNHDMIYIITSHLFLCYTHNYVSLYLCMCMRAKYTVIFSVPV